MLKLETKEDHEIILRIEESLLSKEESKTVLKLLKNDMIPDRPYEQNRKVREEEKALNYEFRICKMEDLNENAKDLKDKGRHYNS